MDKRIQAKLAAGTELYTIDGRRYGNGIIVRTIRPKFGTDPILYEIRQENGISVKMSYPKLILAFHTASGSGLRITHGDVVAQQRRHIRLVTGAKAGSPVHPVYSVRAVSPSLGLERRLLVCAPSKRSVARCVESDPDYRGWVVSGGDTVKLPARVCLSAVQSPVIAVVS